MDDIDSRSGATDVEERMEELRRYVDENIDLLRRQISINPKIAESSDIQPNTENLLVSNLNSEVKFLRDELKRRSDDFQQREASLCKIIEILHSDNTSKRHAHGSTDIAPPNASPGVEQPAWEKPKKAALPRAPPTPSNIESANPFSALREQDNQPPNDNQIPTDDNQRFNNVTERRKNKQST